MTIDSALAQRLTAGETVALVTLVARTGSAPRHPGARMLLTTPDIETDGVEGTIGGGLPEAKSLAVARTVLQGAEPCLLPFDMTSPSPEADLICGGTITLLVERLEPSLAPAFQQASHCLEQGTTGTWIVDITNPGKPVRHFYPGTACPGCRPAPPCPCPIPAKPGIFTADGHTLYAEPLQAEDLVLLCGGGHVALAVGRLAHQVGFEVEVVDDRSEFASPGRFPFARGAHTLPGFAQLTQICAIGPAHYVVIVTRGHAYDREVLSQVLPTTARYIGMIGSKKKREGVYAALKSQGFVTHDLARVHCPIGLDINAETPEEIAVSIVAELIAARRK